MSPIVAVVDYGMGNLRSVAKALEHVAPGIAITVTSDPAVVAASGRVVVPGQGAMPDCMRELEQRGLVDDAVGPVAPRLGSVDGEVLGGGDQALLLRAVDRGEDGRLLTLLTPEHGRVTALALHAPPSARTSFRYAALSLSL